MIEGSVVGGQYPKASVWVGSQAGAFGERGYRYVLASASERP